MLLDNTIICTMEQNCTLSVLNFKRIHSYVFFKSFLPLFSKVEKFLSTAFTRRDYRSRNHENTITETLDSFFDHSSF